MLRIPPTTIGQLRKGRFVLLMAIIATGIVGCDGNVATNEPTVTAADCQISYETRPQNVPLEAMYAASDTVAGYGTSLNRYWNLTSCVFSVDTTLAPNCKNNAISYSYPPVVIYDSEFFAADVQKWGRELPNLIIIAHEWGHQYQYAKNLFTPNDYTIYVELDADTKAGQYIGWLAQTQGVTNVAEIAGLLKQYACSLADPEGLPWWDPQAHGSCEQRAGAIEKGFKDGTRNSTIGRGVVADPQAPASTAGTWSGTMTIYVTVIDEQTGIAVSQTATDNYYVTIGDNGKITDDMGQGPSPDVGQSKTTPLTDESMDMDLIYTVTDFSYDDQATRYEGDLSVEEGTVDNISVTGTGSSTDTYMLLADGRMNVYSYNSLTLTGDTGNKATLVVEGTAILTRQ